MRGHSPPGLFGDWWWQPNRSADDRPATKPLDEEIETMWVYRQENPAWEASKWLVGYWSPEKNWFTESSYGSREEAAARVRWLNGGG